MALAEQIDIITEFTQRLQVAVIGAEETTDKHEKWVEGTETETIPTANGPLKTLRGQIAEWRLSSDSSVQQVIDSYSLTFEQKMDQFDDDFVNYLLTIGFEPAVLYGPGILIERRAQTVAFNGVTYYWGGTLPYTTTGDFGTEPSWLIAPIIGGVEVPQMSFASGGNIVRKTQSVLGADGEWYYWTGTFPKLIAPGSTVESAGGVGQNKFKLSSGVVPLRPLMKIVASSAGLVLNPGSFEYGATISSETDALPHFGTGKLWRWGGVLPKVVDVGSEPLSSGGVGPSQWIEVSTAGGTNAGITISEIPPTGVALGHRWYCTSDGRTYIRYLDSDSVQWVEESPQGSVFEGLEPRIREALRRSYAEVGCDLVGGSFEAGGVLASENEVLLHESSGIAYSSDGPYPVMVQPATNPITTALHNRSNTTYQKVMIEWFVYDNPDMLKDFNDGTLAFKRAIAFVRNLPNPCPIYSGAIQTTISERLFFGPRTSADVITPDGFPTGVCLGFIGLDNQATEIKCGPALAGDVVFDLSGLRDKYLRDFHLISDNQANAPACGILTARFNVSDSGWGSTSNEWGDFSRVVVDKYFTISSMIQASTEETLVDRCRFRNDHVNGKSPVLLTCNLGWSVGSAIQPAPETNLPFTTGTQSTLHQVHRGCDYYYGAGLDSTASEAACIVMHGVNQARIEAPFFNNNARKVDCVRVVGGVPDSQTNNVHIVGANCHKEMRAGIRFVGSNKHCSWTDCTTTIGSTFSDAEVVIEGFTSSLFVNRCSSLSIKSQLINSTVLNCDIATWDSTKYIKSTHLDIETTFTATGTSNTDNNFDLVFAGDSYKIQGKYSAPTSPSADVVITSNKIGRYTRVASNTTAELVESVNEGLSNPIRKIVGPEVSTSQFSYEEYSRGTTRECRVHRGGLFICDLASGGVVLKSANGTQYRLVVSDAGVVSSQPITI